MLALPTSNVCVPPLNGLGLQKGLAISFRLFDLSRVDPVIVWCAAGSVFDGGCVQLSRGPGLSKL